MNMHKKIRLTPLARKAIWQHYGRRNWTIVALAREFRVSRPTSASYQAKLGAKFEARKKAEAKRYNKTTPGR